MRECDEYDEYDEYSEFDQYSEFDEYDEYDLENEMKKNNLIFIFLIRIYKYSQK